MQILHILPPTGKIIITPLGVIAGDNVACVYNKAEPKVSAKNYFIGVFLMTEMVLNTSTLPEPLLRLIRTEKVKVNEINGVISLTPILEIKNGCPLRGLAADSKLTVDKFLAMVHDEKEMR